MNLPNKLTLSRIVLTAVFVFCLFVNGLFAKILAFVIFLIASLTDILDGFLAKRNNQVTGFGKLMDPIADKILTLSAFLAFVEMGLIPAWMAIIIISREVAITGLRMLALTKGKVIPADDGGKHKTVSQVVAIFVILLFLIFKEGGANITAYENLIYLVMLLTTALTLISGAAYLIKNKEVYFNAKEN